MVHIETILFSDKSVAHCWGVGRSMAPGAPPLGNGPPNKSPGCQSSGELPRLAIHHACVVTYVARKSEPCYYDSGAGGTDKQKLAPSLSRMLPCAPIPSADLKLSPCPVVSHGRDDNSSSGFCEPPNTRVVSGTSDRRSRLGVSQLLCLSEFLQLPLHLVSIFSFLSTLQTQISPASQVFPCLSFLLSLSLSSPLPCSASSLPSHPMLFHLSVWPSPWLMAHHLLVSSSEFSSPLFLVSSPPLSQPGFQHFLLSLPLPLASAHHPASRSSSIRVFLPTPFPAP